MAYTQNLNMPRVRRDASSHGGKKIHCFASIARQYEVGTSTISKWVKKAKRYGHVPIPTKSSHPKHHPAQYTKSIIHT